MNLHEYQAKQILRSFGVPVADGIVASTVEEAVEAAAGIQQMTGSRFWVVKAQIHAGGRGKGGGVKLARNLEEVRERASEILGMRLVTPQTGPQGKLVRKVFIQQDVFYPGPSEPKEYYISLLLNRSESKVMVMYSPEGGTEIEEVAETKPDKIFVEIIDRSAGLQLFQGRNIAFNLGLSGEALKNMVRFTDGLYRTYMGADLTLLEINPVLKTSDDKIIAVDCKMRLDRNALFRHPDYAVMRDIYEEDPAEVEAGEYNLNYIKLHGNVGCMVNGAGLAMATMDIIRQSGGQPANFLDVGGTANAERVEKAFRIILKDRSVQAILVNIFGGIVRCDRVAQGIVDAFSNIGDVDIPVIIRLQGTNAREAKELIDKSGLAVYSAVTMQEAADLVNSVIKTRV